MAEAGPVGSFYGPDLTTGSGGRTADFTPADWDAIVRHGVMKDGSRAIMPAVDRTMSPSTLGPVGKILVATGRMGFSADAVAGLGVAHAATPTATEVTPEFGAHVGAPCTGCHGLDLAGGLIPGGPPDWPMAANLTPHADGLAGWSYEDFLTAATEGRRPDGTGIRPPMSFFAPFFGRMTDTELQALRLHLGGLPPVPGPES